MKVLGQHRCGLAPSVIKLSQADQSPTVTWLDHWRAISKIKREESDFLNATYLIRSTAAALLAVTATLTDARPAAGFSTRWGFAL